MPTDIPPLSGAPPQNNLPPWLQAYVGQQPTATPPAGFTIVSAAPTPPSVLNAVAAKAGPVQATVAAADSALQVIYGRKRVGALLAGFAAYQGNLVILALWAQGECDAIEAVTINDISPVTAAINTGNLGATFGITNYLGAPGQVVDPFLVTVYAAQTVPVVYSDVLPGVCYSVIVIPPGLNSGFPRLTATIRGRKIRATQAGARSWSQNPIYCMADFIEDTTYGMGKTVDWTTVAGAAATCDALVGVAAPEKKRQLDLVLDTPQSGETWLNVMRAYASTWIVPEGGQYRFVPDAAGSSVMSFNTTNVVENSLQITRQGTRNIPTVIETVYTDTSVVPWRDNNVSVYAPGVLAGTVPQRRSRVRMPGMNRYSEAYRNSVERLNDGLLSDMSVRFKAFDDALKLQVGDIFDLTHPIGFSAMLFRTLKVDPIESGRWMISAVKYDPAKYSSDVVTGPSTPDTNLPDPSNPPTPAGLTVVEELYQDLSGLWQSRLRATWNAVSFQFLTEYQVDVFAAGQQIDSVLTTQLVYASASVQGGIQYVINVYARSIVAKSKTPATITVIALGKLLPPSDVPSITGYWVNGEVRLFWVTAVDLDLTGYELRYDLTSGSWATSVLLTRVAVPTTSHITKTMPVGTFRIFIKALDSVRTPAAPFGQYSVNATYVDITVQPNPGDTIGITTYAYVTPVLTNVVQVNEPPGSASNWITDYGTTWATLFPAALSTYTSALGSYFGSGTSTIVTESFDLASNVYSTLTNTITWTDLSGTAVVTLETSADNSVWISNPGQTVTTSCRYVRGRITTTGVMSVTSIGTLQSAVTIGAPNMVTASVYLVPATGGF